MGGGAPRGLCLRPGPLLGQRQEGLHRRQQQLVIQLQVEKAIRQREVLSSRAGRISIYFPDVLVEGAGRFCCPGGETHGAGRENLSHGNSPGLANAVASFASALGQVSALSFWIFPCEVGLILSVTW